MLLGKKENFVSSFELPALPRVHELAGSVHPPINKPPINRCSLEKRPSLFDVLFGLCLSKICMSSDHSSTAIKIVNQVSLEVKPGKAGDLPGKALQREELKLCALVPGSL